MSTKRKIIIAAGVIFALLAIGASAVLVLRQLDPDPSQTTPGAVDRTEDEGDTEQGLERAEALENEANEIISTDPAAAYDKFIEAEKVYIEAGNDPKASEMLDNAASAEAGMPVDEPTEEPTEEPPLSGIRRP